MPTMFGTLQYKLGAADIIGRPSPHGPIYPAQLCIEVYAAVPSLVEASLRTAWIKQGDTVGVEKVFPIRATENFLQKISFGTYCISI